MLQYELHVYQHTLSAVQFVEIRDNNENVIQSFSKVINFQIKNIQFVIKNIYNQLFVEIHKLRGRSTINLRQVRVIFISILTLKFIIRRNYIFKL